MTQQLRIAHITAEAVARIRELEQATGKHIMAFEQGLRFATLLEFGENDVKWKTRG